MRTLPIIFLIALLSFLFDSCRHDADSRLTAAEALMDERPDSALIILDSIDPAGLCGDENRALYAMLLTMARDKNNLDPTDDSLISIAADYYRTHDDPLRNAISSYYQGRVYYLRDSMPAALVSYMRAKDIAERNDLYFWASMGCRGVSEVYQNLGNYGSQLTYARKQKDYIFRDGKQPYLNYALPDYACALQNTFHIDSALLVYDQALDSAYSSGDSNLYYMTIRSKSQYLLGMEKYDEAYPLLQTIWQAGVALPMDSANLAWCLASMGRVQEAINMLDTVKGDGRPVEYTIKARYFKDNGDYKNAYIELERLDSVISHTYQASMSHNMSDHLEAYYDISRQLDQAKVKDARMKLWLLLIGSTVLIILLVGIGVYLYKKNKRKMEMELLLADQTRQELIERHAKILTSINQDLESAEEESRRHLSEVSDLRISLDQTQCERDRFSSLLQSLRNAENTLLEDLGRIINTDDRRSMLTNRKLTEAINQFVHTYSGKEDEVTALEEYADILHSNIMTDLRREVPEMNETDRRLFLFSVLNYSIIATTLLLGETKVDRIYDRRRRIKKKLSVLPEDLAAKYLKFL